MESQIIKMHIKYQQCVAPLFVPMAIGNMVAGNISMKIEHAARRTSLVTACATELMLLRSVPQH